MTLQQIENKRQQVRALYRISKKKYEQAHRELHDMAMKYMAIQYREYNGLPPDAKTPYCN